MMMSSVVSIGTGSHAAITQISREYHAEIADRSVLRMFLMTSKIVRGPANEVIYAATD